jgi:DNA-binding NtrC family response regulator
MSSEDTSIYVVDDDAAVREAIVEATRSWGFSSVGFRSAREFLSHRRPSGRACLVLDVEMPELSGLELQRRLNAEKVRLPIVFVTGHGSIPMSVKALRAGASDFMTKPFEPEALVESIERALRQYDQRADRKPLAPGSDAGALDGIAGTSSALERVLQQVRSVGATDTTVLILGETGTGKELIASALHRASRRQGCFVKVNCGAIPGTLLESELLGHERGAFTGAVSQRIGRFEQAHEGTLFLDEIGEMPLEQQPKLLRLLQEREFERVGSTRTMRSDVRVIAATNRDLKSMVTERMFREDLYYRLSVFPIRLPPLRERVEDIPELVRHILHKCAGRAGKVVDEIPPATFEYLTRQAWRGNVRELENAIERAVILAPGRTLTPELFCSSEATVDLDEASDGLSDVCRAHVLRVLKETNWLIAGPNGAAARLQIKRSTLNFRLKKWGIERPK